jgi:death-on-curing protein
VIFLDLDDVLHVAKRTLWEPPQVRDIGLLESALARPQATAHGRDAYPTIHDKAAALVHSLTCNHALVDGNKRLALAGLIAFYGVNSLRLTLSNEDAYLLIVDIAEGHLDEVATIARRLKASTKPQP